MMKILILIFVLSIPCFAEFNGIWRYNEDATKEYLEANNFNMAPSTKLDNFTIFDSNIFINKKNHPYYTTSIDGSTALTVFTSSNAPIIISKEGKHLRVLNASGTPLLFFKSSDIKEDDAFPELSGKWTIDLKAMMKNEGKLPFPVEKDKIDLNHLNFIDYELKGNHLIFYIAGLPVKSPQKVTVSLKKISEGLYKLKATSLNEEMSLSLKGDTLEVKSRKIKITLFRHKPLQKRRFTESEIKKEAANYLTWLKKHKSDDDIDSYYSALIKGYTCLKDKATIIKLIPEIIKLEDDFKAYALYECISALFEFKDFGKVEELFKEVEKLKQEPGDLTGMYLFMCEEAFDSNQKDLAQKYLKKGLESHKKDLKKIEAMPSEDKIYYMDTALHSECYIIYCCKLTSTPETYSKKLKNNLKYKIRQEYYLFDKYSKQLNFVKAESFLNKALKLLPKDEDTYSETLDEISYSLIGSYKKRPLIKLPKKLNEEKYPLCSYNDTMVNLAVYYQNCDDVGMMLNCLYRIEDVSELIHTLAFPYLVAPLNSATSKAVRNLATLEDVTNYYALEYFQYLLLMQKRSQVSSPF